MSHLTKEELQKLYDELGTVQKVAVALGIGRRTAQQLLKKKSVAVRSLGVHTNASLLLKKNLVDCLVKIREVL